MPEIRTVDIGLIGWGTVGGGVVEILRRDADLFAERCGLRLRLAAIVTRTPSRAREQGAPEGCSVSDRIESITGNPAIAAVCHLVGGTGEARSLMEACLRAGKPVVTANKALIAEHGDSLFALAAQHRSAIAFEAAVAGGIPVIAALRDGLVANRIDAIHAILNGTCNFILTRMEQDGASYADALAEAQRLGYAEADPTLDVSGMDTAHKLAILARISANQRIPLAAIPVDGITGITVEDMASAATMGFRLKLIASAIQRRGSLALRVAPTMVATDHPLASVMQSANGIAFSTSAAGPTLLVGRGAGALPTASAVLADVVDVVTGRYGLTSRSFSFLSTTTSITPLPQTEEVSSFYLRFSVEDKSGVLARIASALSHMGVSIRSLHQAGARGGSVAGIAVITHPARRGDVEGAIRLVEGSGVLKASTVLYQVLLAEW